MNPHFHPSPPQDPSGGRRAVLQALAATTTAVLLAQVPLARAQNPLRVASDWFRLGIASGSPTDTSLVLWTRLAPVDEAELLAALGALPNKEAGLGVDWELADDAQFTKVRQRGRVFASPALGWSVHAEVTGLPPDRWYFYRFRVGDLVSPLGRTRTLPAPGALTRQFRIATASCQNADQGHWAAWRHMQSEQVDAVLFLGDYIYEYPMAGRFGHARSMGWAYNLETYRARYAIYKSHPELQAMHAQAPWVVTWDDHELQNDYAGANAGFSGPRGVDFAQRRVHAYQAYYENMPLPLSVLTQGLMGLATGAEMRHYRRVQVGHLLNLYLLDNRQYKDAPACSLFERKGKSRVNPDQCERWSDPRQSMLGMAQEQWLDQQLAQAGVRGRGRNGGSGSTNGVPVWNLMAQSTLFGRRDNRIGAGEGFFYEGWDAYDAARTRLLQSLARHQVPNPVMLGGDVHEHWAGYLKADYQRLESARLGVEFTTTSISSRGNSVADNAGLLAENPHFVHNTPDKRGYTVLHITPKALTADLKALDDVTQLDSTIQSAAKFTVVAGRMELERG